MMYVNGMNVMENAMFIKYLNDVNLPVGDSIKQLNKLGVIMPTHHFIKRLQFEKVNERELFEENKLLDKEQLKKCSFIFEKYIVLHVVMVNDEKYEFILRWNELEDLKSRFKEVNEQIKFYLENYEKINKNFLDELNRNLLQIYK